jgi:hypothetical protein
VIGEQNRTGDRPLPREELRVFGVDLRRAYPLPDDRAFADLLTALDRIASRQ